MKLAGTVSVIWLSSLLCTVGGQLFGLRQCNANIQSKYNFDINQYLGKWYEIRRYYPVWFEFSLKCGVAEYALKENGNIQVKNTGTDRLTGVREEPVIGEAKILNQTVTDASKLYVEFGDDSSGLSAGSIFTSAALDNGNYWVLDTDYVNFAIVFSCINFPGIGRSDIVWILGRRPSLDQDTLDYIYELLNENKIRTKYLYPVEQNCGV